MPWSHLLLAALALGPLGASAQSAIPDLNTNTNYYNPCLQPNSSVANVRAASPRSAHSPSCQLLNPSARARRENRLCLA
jgi:hypothetical protein